MGFTDRLSHAWSTLRGKNEPLAVEPYQDIGPSSARQISRSYYRPLGGSKNLTTSIYNTIAMDVAAIQLMHVRVDENERYLETIRSGLHRCLNLEANIDESARAFKQNIVQTMFEQGVVAVVPVDTSIDIREGNAFEIKTMRVGRITQFYPRHVRVELYNDKTGTHDEVLLPKDVVAIIENPLYSVMNEPNSYLQQLVRALNRMDSIDEQIASGKLDLLIQLPYTVKSQSRIDQAEKRRASLEEQLRDSVYGIGYLDATEKVTQLNRPIENGMLTRVEYLTKMLYSQMGLTPAVFDGTADEKAMINYYNRTIEPILAAIAQGMTRKFITKTAQTQGQRVEYYRDPFQLVAVNEFSEIADKFTRNEILTSNEIRGLVGMRPSDDPKADQLRNSNVPQNDPAMQPQSEGVEVVEDDPNDDPTAIMNSGFDEVEAAVDDILKEFGDV